MAAKEKAKEKAKAKAKAKAKKKVAAPAAGAAGAGGPVGRCDQGEELTPPIVLALPGQRVDVRIDVCQSPGTAVVIFAGQTVLRQPIASVVEAPIMAPTQPGDYLLIWGVSPGTTPWRAKGEIRLGAAVLFRHKKNDTSGFPLAKWAVFVRVQA